ncbi:hypothetical protein [Methanobrevibacter sp.]
MLSIHYGLDVKCDEIYENYLSNFEEEQPVGERIFDDNADII